MCHGRTPKDGRQCLNYRSVSAVLEIHAPLKEIKADVPNLVDVIQSRCLEFYRGNLSERGSIKKKTPSFSFCDLERVGGLIVANPISFVYSPFFRGWHTIPGI